MLACRTFTFEPNKLQHDFAAVRGATMFDQIDALPGAERELAVFTGTCSETPVSIALTWAGMSSGPSMSCDPAGVLGRQPVERGNQVGLHVGIGVLLDGERSRGVAQVDQ